MNDGPVMGMSLALADFRSKLDSAGNLGDVVQGRH
jgi:hypothetical protein